MAKKKVSTEVSENVLASEYLRQIANCLAYLALQTEGLRGKEKKDLIPILTSWGFDRHATASLLQTSPESVSVRMSELKAETKVKNTAKKVQETTKVSSEQ